MYRLLVIDDEPFIVDWIYEMFSKCDELELDIYKAYSGFEALEILNKAKIDIVLTDIRMPDINGLELLKEIRSSWPFCKVIFLTAYDNFEYAHEANKDGVAYILKTEGDDEIIKAVKKAVCEINNQLKQDELIKKAKKNIEIALPIMQREFLLELLEGENTAELTQRHFRELDIHLSVRDEFFLLIGRCDDWFVSMPIKEKANQSVMIQAIVNNYFSPKLKYAFVQLDNAVLVWIIQPQKEDAEEIGAKIWNKIMIYLKGILDSVQKQCNKNIGTSISFVMDSKPSPWDKISERFSSLVQLLIYDGINSKEIVMTKQYPSKDDEVKDSYDENMRNVSACMNKMHSLEAYLESGQRKEFFGLFLQIRKTLSPIARPHRSVGIEAYHSIALMFLKYINHNGRLAEKLSLNTDLHILYDISAENFDEVFDLFERIADNIFLYQQNDSKRKQNSMIASLNEYIHSNLDKDLSLVNLADRVYLNPTYLSRIYKQTTGINLSAYINDVRFSEAKKMLKESNIKVHEISDLVGFGSVSYFIRSFKEATGMTPQEYRER